MATLGGYYQAEGSNWYLAKSLQTLASEVAERYPDVTCLGTLGNAAHQAEGTGSDHNPWVINPSNNMGVVRAIDLGGPDATLQAIRARVWALYFAQDPRLWQYGYSKGTSDNQINDWSPTYGHHTDMGDAGHLHVSVTSATRNPGTSAYAPAIDSTAGWGIASPDGASQPAVPVPVPLEDPMTILVDQEGHRIGALDQCGRTFTFTGSEWGAMAAVITKLPADRKPTIVQVTKAQYDALPRVTR